MDHAIIELISPHTGHIERIKSAPGFGSSSTGLIEADRGRFFVKATPKVSLDLESAQREAAINPFVTEVAPAVRWQTEDKQWFVAGFDVVEGREAGFLPGSADLAAVIETVNRVSAIPLPGIAQGWVETRWDRFTSQEERTLLRGDVLTHTDIHSQNFVLGEDRVWLVDWEWPTCATPAVMPTTLAVQLVAAGHTPVSAESWVSKTNAWRSATGESLESLARANVRMHWWFTELRPGEDWLKEMADAAEAWSNHLAG